MDLPAFASKAIVPLSTQFSPFAWTKAGPKTGQSATGPVADVGPRETFPAQSEITPAPLVEPIPR